ncbi:MAG: hypothetical protein AABW59_01065 [archaeon]
MYSAFRKVQEIEKEGDMMSLVTLTFNSANNATSGGVGRGKIKVIKTEKFYGSDDLCVIGKLVEGAVAKKMFVAGKCGTSINSVESKYGDGLCSKEGAQVVLMISGVQKSEFGEGAEIMFERSIQEQQKTKGRVIIA